MVNNYTNINKTTTTCSSLRENNNILDYWKANKFLYCINKYFIITIYFLQNHNLFTFEDVSSHNFVSFDAAPLSRNQTSWPFVGFTLAAGKGISSFPSNTL